MFVFIFISLGGGSKKILLGFTSGCSMFSSKSFIVYSLTFGLSFILNLFLCIMLENVLISFSCSCPIFSVPCIEESVFSPLYILAAFVKTLCDINHSRILYDPPPRILEIKAKINKQDQLKLKASAQQRKL